MFYCRSVEQSKNRSARIMAESADDELHMCEECREEKYRGDFSPEDPKKRRNRKCKSCVIETKYGINDDMLLGNFLGLQGERCAICRKSLPLKADGRPECHIDHNHDDRYKSTTFPGSHSVRGFLCRNCNLGLGHFKENWKICQQAALYLRNNGNVYRPGKNFTKYLEALELNHEEELEHLKQIELD
jgi:hypothetical protein